MALTTQELEEQVAYYKSELGLTDRTTETGRVCKTLHLNRQQGKLLMALYWANGRILSTVHLMDLIDTSCDNPRIIGVLVSQIRNKADMGGMIQSNWGLGYNLSAEGRGLVKGVLEAAS